MNFFRRKNPRQPQPPVGQPQTDPVAAIADGLSQILAMPPGEMWIIVDDGNARGTRYAQFIVSSNDGELMGEISVEEVDELRHPILQSTGWMPGDINWEQVWPVGTSPHKIAQTCVDTMRELYGRDMAFYIQIHYA